MRYLRPTATVSVWPRNTLVFDASVGWQCIETPNCDTWHEFVQTLTIPNDAPLCQTFENFLTSSPLVEEAPTPAQQIRKLDGRYNGWLPNLPTDIEKHAGAVAMWNQRLRVRSELAPAPFSLPGSAARIANLILRQSPQSIYFDSDPNGLAHLLAHHATSTVRVSCATTKLRLESIAALEETAGRVSLVEHGKTQATHDLSIGYASTPKETIALIASLHAQTKPGGLLGLISRKPHDHWLYDFLKECNLQVTEVFRDVDTWLIHEGYAVDHTADFLILQRPESAPPEVSDNGTTFNLRAQPYTPIDFNQLGHDRLNAESLTELADLVDAMGPHAPCHRHIQTCPEHLSLSYYDEKGFGFVIDVRPKPAHASLTFMPYHPVLERAAVHAVFLALAGPWTRLAAERTWWSGTDSVIN